MTKNAHRLLAMGMAMALAASAHAQSSGPGGLSKSETLQAKAQAICPVSGQDLFAMGGPAKAKVGEQTVFVCCRGCLKGQIKKHHWAAMHANLAAAQGKCPVMDKPLPKSAKVTVVNGRAVFVCCPPCTKKIAAKPEQYLAEVDQLLERNLAAQQQTPRR